MAKKLWIKMPTNWIHKDGLRAFGWSVRSVKVSNAHKIAALQLYVAIAMTCEDMEITNQEGPSLTCFASSLTYNRLQVMTGLSRASVAGGLSLLEEKEIIKVFREGRKNYYSPADYNGVSGWCKVPYRRLLNDQGNVTAFHAFKLRRKAELHALKLYLYLCYARPNTSHFTMASYEAINKATGIPEKFIPAAYTVLVGTGLLSHIDKSAEEGATNKRMANSYYITGYRDLLQNFERVQQKGPA